eukprot:CCRYP_011402-RA/>CCRYP_011402-RA protein AED:0.42 eAED:0.42 QI:0/-1/0/1/-1/1/1/0/214
MESVLRNLQNIKGSGGKTRRHQQNFPKQDYEGVAFPQLGNQSGEHAERDISNHTCYNCGKKGHHAKTWPKLSGNEQTQLGIYHVNVSETIENFVEGANFNLHANEMETDSDYDESDGTYDSCIEGVRFLEVAGERHRRMTCNRNHAYLHSCAMNHSAFALEHLNRLHTRGVCLRQNCNGGSQTTKRKGFWKMLPFWENLDRIANLISLIKLERD